MPTPPPDRPKSNDQQPGTDSPARARRNGRQWADVIEEMLQEAQDRGDFNDLKGKGKPLDLNRNPYAGDRELAFNLLKNNDLLPPEIERTREIDNQIRLADDLLAGLRRRRDALLARGAAVSANDRRAYNLVRDKTETQYEQAIRAINSNILSLNIVAPPALHRVRLDLDARLQAFRDEFPRMAE